MPPNPLSASPANRRVPSPSWRLHFLPRTDPEKTAVKGGRAEEIGDDRPCAQLQHTISTRAKHEGNGVLPPLTVGAHAVTCLQEAD